MTSEGYAGQALLHTGGDAFPVDVRLAGHIEPVDGRFHWGGRIDTHAATAELVRSGARGVTMSIAGAAPVPVRLAEVDPWGGVRVTATGQPPWSSVVSANSSRVATTAEEEI